MGDVVGTCGGSERREGGANRLPQGGLRPSRRRAQPRLAGLLRSICPRASHTPARGKSPTDVSDSLKVL